MDNLIEATMLKVTGAGLLLLVAFGITKADIAFIAGVISSLASALYWGVKFYRDFIRKKKSK